MQKIIRAVDAMFVWTPDAELYDRRTYPLRGTVDVDDDSESAYSWQHPRSAGACDAGWGTVDHWQMAQKLVTTIILEDNIRNYEVRRAFMQVDEFASFPFSIEPPESTESAQRFLRG